MSTAGTLLDLFEPPEGMVGHSAALVAMTAAEDFLEAALLRFTGLGPRQRAELGKVLAYLMLDGHPSASRQNTLRPGRVPGLHEFQPRPVVPRSLLHAKLALLGFASSRTAGPSHLRLAVLTANYTYASAKRQLELAWAIDLPLDGTASAADRAELAEAGVFVARLLDSRFHRDEQALPAGQRNLTARLDQLLAAAAKIAPARPRPRFIHSLDAPLYAQIRERFRSGVDARRNLLLCGSGFYEQPSKEAKKPEVLSKLEDLGVLTARARRVALVERGQAGAVATWAVQGNTEGWELARPSDALGRGRSLHAKFVYVGYLRDGHVSNGWLYLGSGNLSRTGLLESGATARGNIECGVVVPVKERLDSAQLERALFWRPDAGTIDADAWAVDQADDTPELPEEPDMWPDTWIEVPPILSASIEDPGRALRLLWRDDLPEGTRARIRWTGRDWQSVTHDRALVPLEDTDQPTALHVRDDSADREWIVPVVDSAGRVCWQPPRFTTYADALAALLDFPMRLAEDTDPDDENGDDDPGGDGAHGPGAGDGQRERAETKSYALHAAAELIEKVAACQRALAPLMIDDWLDHLDRALRASFPESLVSTWREHGIDVLRHLRQPELSPPDMGETQRRRYCDILDRTARSWGLS